MVLIANHRWINSFSIFHHLNRRDRCSFHWVKGFIILPAIFSCWSQVCMWIKYLKIHEHNFNFHATHIFAISGIHQSIMDMNIFQTSELMDICSGPTVAIAEVFSIPQHLLDSRPRDWRPEREGIYETMYKWSADRFRKHFRMSQGW